MKLTYPNGVKATLHGNFDLMPNQTIPAGKIIGFTPSIEGMSLANVKSKGVTHLYSRSGLPVADAHETMLPNQYGLNVFTSAVQAYILGINAASNFTSNSVLTEQFVEGAGQDYVLNANYWAVVSAFFKGMADTIGGANLFGSYVKEYSNITGCTKFNLNNGGYTSSPLASYFVDGLTTQANARKVWNKNTQSVDGDFPFFTSHGSIPAMSSFMGLQTSCLNGFNEPDDSLVPLEYFYEIQRKFAAGVDNQLVYLTTWAESVTLDMDTQAKNSGNKVLRNDLQQGAYWEIKDHHATPPHVILFMSFIGLLLTRGVVFFDSTREDYSKNPAKMKDDAYLSSLGYVSFKSNPTIPTPPFNTVGNDYPTKAHCIQDLALVALSWYNACKPLLDAGLQLRYLDFNKGGNNYNVDLSGTSDRRIFTSTVKPYGQHTVLHNAANNSPLCFGGKLGNNYIVIYYDWSGSPLVTNNLFVDFDASGNNLTDVGVVQGRTLAVFVV